MGYVMIKPRLTSKLLEYSRNEQVCSLIDHFWGDEYTCIFVMHMMNDI